MKKIRNYTRCRFQLVMVVAASVPPNVHERSRVRVILAFMDAVALTNV